MMNATVLLQQHVTNDKSTLVRVMACCHQATSHNMHQSWPRSVPLYGISQPLTQPFTSCWVTLKNINICRNENFTSFLVSRNTDRESPPQGSKWNEIFNSWWVQRISTKHIWPNKIHFTKHYRSIPFSHHHTKCTSLNVMPFHIIMLYLHIWHYVSDIHHKMKKKVPISFRQVSNICPTSSCQISDISDDMLSNLLNFGPKWITVL